MYGWDRGMSTGYGGWCATPFPCHWPGDRGDGKFCVRARRERIPRRVPDAQTTDEEVIKLATQKKHLTNVIKLVAYQAESELVRQLSPHYRRAQLEGRTLVHSALASAADIKVTDNELLITLAPLSSAHRSRAVAALCASLNATSTIFPGTRLRLRYAVAGQT